MKNACTNYQEIASKLYSFLGRAVWAIQHLEDALNHAIAIKNPEATTKKKGDAILNSHRQLPLGRAIGQAEKEKIFSKALQNDLQNFLMERNWLIHRCMHESVNEMGFVLDPDKLFNRIRTIESTASYLTETIEIDMLEFIKSKGREDIVESVKKSYVEWLNAYGPANVTSENP